MDEVSLKCSFSIIWTSQYGYCDVLEWVPWLSRNLTVIVPLYGGVRHISLIFQHGIRAT